MIMSAAKIIDTLLLRSKVMPTRAANFVNSKKCPQYFLGACLTSLWTVPINSPHVW